MGYLFIDDSVHDNAGFVLMACVYTNVDPTGRINDILMKHGFNPNEVEYKSSHTYSTDNPMKEVREELKQYLMHDCKFGVVIIPRTKRAEAGKISLTAAKQFLSLNNIERPCKIYFDQGLFTSIKAATDIVAANQLCDVEFLIEQDSKKASGLQLADMAAHAASICLKDKLGLVTKMVKAGENSGYDPEMELELGFEMWAAIRYCFFFSPDSKEYTDDPIVDGTVVVEPYGLFIDADCNGRLTEKARDAFGTMYLGCIH